MQGNPTVTTPARSWCDVTLAAIRRSAARTHVLACMHGWAAVQVQATARRRHATHCMQRDVQRVGVGRRMHQSNQSAKGPPGLSQPACTQSGAALTRPGPKRRYTHQRFVYT